MYYRIDRLVHVCINNMEHPDSPVWAHGKWFYKLKLLEGTELRCPFCQSELNDPNECNFIQGNIIVTYIQKHLQIPIQYFGLYIKKVDKRRKEFKE